MLQIDDDVTSRDYTFSGSTPEFARRVAYRMVSTPTGVLVAHQLQQTTPLPVTACGASFGGGSAAGGAGGGSGKPFSIVSSGLSAVGSNVLGQLPPDAVLPVDLAATSGGDWAVVAAGSRKTFWFHKATGVTERIESLGEPTAVGFRGTDLIVFSREPAATWIKAPGGVLSKVPLPGVSMASTGHELFHRATFAGLSCASCHPEAPDDGHTCLLPEGFRRTNMLRGGLKVTAPFHWRGDRRDIQGTNNANSNVGTGGEFQVPRLVGLAMRAPCFHDGRVGTLAARFDTIGGAEAHGHTSTLTPAQKADLVEYLRSR